MVRTEQVAGFFAGGVNICTRGVYFRKHCNYQYLRINLQFPAIMLWFGSGIDVALDMP